MDTIHIYEDKAGQYRWRRRARNGRIISHGESHPRERDAFRAAERANQDTDWTYHRDNLRKP